MNNNHLPASNFQKSEQETGNQVSLALDGLILLRKGDFRGIRCLLKTAF